jgi:type IV pilus assembly protein PilO
VASLSLSKLSWTTQLALFVVISAGLAGAFYYYVEQKEQADIAVRQRALGEIEARLNKGREMARQLPEFRRQITELEGRLASLRPILPEEKDVADLLRRIQTLATQSSLTIRGFRPQAINTRELHAEWPIGLELQGNYHSLGVFLDRVSKFPRIINVGNIEITNRDDRNTRDNREDPESRATIDVSCTATTFVLIDKPAEADTTGKKKGAPAKKTPAKKTE